MIYRLRPACETTIDELKNEYLWFSKPCLFKDNTRDANISAFVNKNEGLEQALSRIYTKLGIEEYINRSRHIGICCFTDRLPKNRNNWSLFPNGLNSIAIEYDETKLLNEFQKIGKGNPFIPVEYVYNPLSLEIDNGNTYMRETIDDNSYLLHNIDGEIRYDANHGLQKIMTLLLSRISKEYESQHEIRVFLSGIHLICDDSKSGYQMNVSNDCISKIFIPKRVVNRNKNFIESLTAIESIAHKLDFQ